MLAAFLEGVIFMTRIEHYAKCKYDVCAAKNLPFSVLFLFGVDL